MDYNRNAPSPSQGLGIASMVLGIIALILFWYMYISIPAAIVGLVLGIINKRNLSEAGVSAGMATAGIVLSIITIALSILFIIACGALLAALGSAIGSMSSEFLEILEALEALYDAQNAVVAV